MSDDAKDKQPPAGNFSEAESCIVRNAFCPHCTISGYVRISPFILNGERHLHWHCPRCRHVWVERDRRRSERFAYNPPLAKQHRPGRYGDLWTWVGQDADSKLVLSWQVGRRDAQTAYPFMHDLASRLSSRVQLTTDGLHAYLEATDAAFGTEIDYARLIKVYGSDPNAERRYAPPVCIETKVQVITGDPAIEHISTSYGSRAP